MGGIPEAATGRSVNRPARRLRREWDPILVGGPPAKINNLSRKDQNHLTISNLNLATEPGPAHGASDPAYEAGSELISNIHAYVYWLWEIREVAYHGALTSHSQFSELEMCHFSAVCFPNLLHGA
jgi:hypothetical protein